MFSGIIETIGEITDIEISGTNKIFRVKSDISGESYIDQSIAHNGVCLTVIKKTETEHWVEAVEETLLKSNLNDAQIGNILNLERCIKMSDRLDGHIVQGHVDTVVTCIKIKQKDGSWNFHFEYAPEYDHLLVEKGSVTINGTSLTVINPEKSQFHVTIIPYTFEHTQFRELKVGDSANIEFDIIGKYVSKWMEGRKE